jgi:hypothetical protein
MPYLGSRTVADCQALALALHPKVRGLRAAYDRMRPRWEARDLMGARCYGRDLSQLEARWRTAVKRAQSVRVAKGRSAATTFADKPHAKMVRAVRQGGAGGQLRPGDLADLVKRLSRTYERLRPATFGYDVADPYGSAMTSGGAAGGLPSGGAGLTRSVADCAALVGQYGDAVNAAIGKSGRGPCAEWQTALTLLALKAGDPTLAAQALEAPGDVARLVAADEDLASTPAEEVHGLLVRVIGDWVPSGADIGLDLPSAQDVRDAASSAAQSVTSAASSAYDGASTALSSAASAVSDGLPSAQAVQDTVTGAGTSVATAMGNAWQSAKDSYQSTKTALKNEVDEEVDRITKPVSDAMPWVKGAVVVAGVGVIGYALAQIATLTSGMRRSA